MSAEASTPVPARQTGRKWLRRALVALSVLVLAVASLPYVAAWRPVRDWIFARAFKDLDGEVRVADARFGWFAPVGLSEFEIRSRDGRVVVHVPEIVGARPVWQVFRHPGDLDQITIRQPELNVLLTPQGSNLAQLRRPGASEAAAPPATTSGWWRRLGGAVQISDGRVSVQSEHSPQPWSIEKLNLGIKLEPAADAPVGSPVLVIRDGTILDHAAVTPAMCEDVLKYVAPILAEATQVEGQVSLTIGEGRFPLDAPKEGSIAGLLSVDQVAVSPGRLGKQLAELLKVSPSIELIRQSEIAFEMRDGRVRHENLTFALGGMEVSTTGSVGFDHTLDLVAQVKFPAGFLGEGPVLRAFSEKPFRVPVGGTLEKPELRGEELASALFAAVAEASQNLANGEKMQFNGEFFKDLIERFRPQDGEPTDSLWQKLLSGEREDARMFNGRFLDRIRNRNRGL
jgi:hypothetical protein